MKETECKSAVHCPTSIVKLESFLKIFFFFQWNGFLAKKKEIFSWDSFAIHLFLHMYMKLFWLYIAKGNVSLNAFQSAIAECVGSIFCALHEWQAAHPRHQLQFISATTAPNQMTVPQGPSKAEIISQLSLMKEKIIPSAFFQENNLSAQEK